MIGQIQPDNGPSFLNNFYDKEYFDGGKGYHRYADDIRFQQDADMIVRLFNPASVLEIGCAKGYFVKALRDRGVKAYGIDTSEYAINQAPESVQDFLWQHDITTTGRIEFPPVELVVSFDTFEHIPEGYLPAVYQFMQDYGDQYYARVGTLQTPNWEHDPSHITMHRLEWWEQRMPKVFWEESK